MDMRKLLEAVTKFAGEPEQKPGEQWKGTDSAPPGKKLVGDSIIKDLAKGPTPKTKEQELAEAYAKFLEDNLGVEEKRPSRKGSRPARDMGKTGEPSKRYNKVGETDQGASKSAETKFHKKLDALVHDTFGRRKEEMKEGWGRGNDRVTLPDEPSTYWAGKGQLQQEYDALYNELVPSQGKADTIEGEVLRAASKIVYRHYNDGDEFNQESFEQLVPYIGAVTSYDDLAHKATEFAIKANGNYTPNPSWDSLDVMEYGPTQDDDDYDDEDEYYDQDNPDNWDDEEDDEVDEGMEEFAKSQAKQRAAKRKSISWPKEVPSDASQERNDDEENDPHPYTPVSEEWQDGADLISQWNIPQQEWAQFETAVEDVLAATESDEAWEQFWQVINDDLQYLDKPLRSAFEHSLGSMNADEVTEAVLNGLRGGYDSAGTEPRAALGLLTDIIEDGVRKLGMNEGWESGPEERSSSRERDPDDAYDDMRQQKADDEAQAAQAKRPQTKVYTLSGRGPNMEPNYAFPGEYNSLDAAVAARKEIMADPKTPNPRMIGISSRTKYLDESEEEQIFTLVSDAGKRTIQGTSTRAKKIVRSLMMQQQLGDKFKLIDGEGSVVLSHGYAKSNTPAKPGSVHTTNTLVAHGAEVAKPELDPEGEYYSLNDIYDYVLNPPEDDEEEYRPREKDVTPDVRRVAEDAERKFPAPRPATPEEIKRGGTSNKSLMMKNGMIYHHQDPRAHQVKEGIESGDPVEGAVLSAVQELIQQGHTEVAPEVITNMVVAATSQPFLLKDLVDANKNSSAIQHYVDSINPTKVKFSSDILTVKNENPAKKTKQQAQTGVANMAARAANRPRLGEASTPLRDREDYDAKNKALQDIQMDPSTSQDPQLSAELARRKAELVQQAKQLGISESRAHKLIANKLKQIELQRQFGSPESDAAYAQHVDSLKKSKEEYLKKTPNTIYKREVEEAGANNPAQTATPTAPATPAEDPTEKQQAAKVAQATNALKSATGATAPAPTIAKALDAATQGKSVGATDMKALEPMLDVVGAAAQDPELANQFKTLASQAKQVQQTAAQQQPKV
jgi:hypothetical protein